MMRNNKLRWLALLMVMVMALALVAGCSSKDQATTDTSKKTEEKPKIEKDPSSKIELDKASYNPEEDMVVNVTVPETYVKTAWLGVVPSSYDHTFKAANQKYVTWDSLSGEKTGKLIIKAPKEPGTYDVRLLTDQDEAKGKEINYATFEVNAPAGSNVSKTIDKDPASSIELDKQSYKVKEQIVVTYKAPATYSANNGWIGTVPASVYHGSVDVNEAYDLYWTSIPSEPSGKIVLNGPEIPGTYDVRMNSGWDSTKGKEVNYVTFTVTE